MITTKNNTQVPSQLQDLYSYKSPDGETTSWCKRIDDKVVSYTFSNFDRTVWMIHTYDTSFDYTNLQHQEEWYRFQNDEKFIPVDEFETYLTK